MERIAQEVFSMRMMVVALFVFLVSIGLATFVETVYDTQTAKIMVYNANWFVLLLTYLSIGMIANIFRHRMFEREKIAMLSFHVAFIIMIIGAGVTRFFGFEGLMLIREGETVAHMYSSEPYLSIEIADDKDKSGWDVLAYMSEATNNSFSYPVRLMKGKKEKKSVQIEYVDYKKNMVDSLVTNPKFSETALGLAIGSTTPEYLCEGEFRMLGDVAVSYQKNDAMPGVHIWKDGNKFKMKSVMGMRSLPMTRLRQIRESGGGVPDSMYTMIEPNEVILLEEATLYNVMGQQFVLQDIKKHTRHELKKSSVKDAGLDYVYVRIRDGKKVSPAYPIPGGKGRLQQKIKFAFEGYKYSIGYGSKEIPMPFAVKCRDFQLDRYPGSNSPSSFASELTIIDEEMGKTFDKRLFMNHVIDYRGYRLFQSGYDQDEMGTHLSVNHDWWGTNISYLGYLLMGVGMLLSFFAPAGRMRELFRKIGKLQEKAANAQNVLLLLIGLSFAFSGTAQDSLSHEGHDHAQHTGEMKPPKKGELYIMSEEHSEEVASLLVQKDARRMPLHTLCDQLLRKLYRDNKYEGYNAVQTVMSMHMYPQYWAYEKVIYISSKGDLRKKLGTGSHAAFLDLLDLKTGQFKWEAEYRKAHQKPESQRDEYDKQLIKVAERFNIMSGIFSGDWIYLKIVPIKGKPGAEWKSIIEFDMDSEEFKVAVDYFGALNEACVSKSGGFGTASDNLKKLKALQRKIGSKDIPSEQMVNMEITYNKMETEKNASRLFGMVGFLMLVFFFLGLLVKENWKAFKGFTKYGSIVLFVVAIGGFLFLSAGLLIRALVSGHVPWGDGYEALIFISWAALLTGLILYRRLKILLAAAALLAFFLLFVSSMGLLDPEITQLQPVLKSYWLKIHVAIITGSYAPLGIGAIMGLITLILFIMRKRGSDNRITLMIKEFTYITEILITIGVVMLTIGTFLGGIWANESWGRYWGWDPKETWALVAILAYAVILHLRFIPALKDKFTFNVAALWGYSTILFTFFGVNFYLVGLHSYANGEGLAELPAWLTIVVAGFYIFTEIASLKNQLYLSKGGAIPMGYFTKKLGILSVMIVIIALMMLWFKVSPVAVIFENTGKVLGLILVVNAILYVIGTATRKGGDTPQTLDETI